MTTTELSEDTIKEGVSLGSTRNEEASGKWWALCGAAELMDEDYDNPSGEDLDYVLHNWHENYGEEQPDVLKKEDYDPPEMYTDKIEEEEKEIDEDAAMSCHDDDNSRDGDGDEDGDEDDVDDSDFDVDNDCNEIHSSSQGNEDGEDGRDLDECNNDEGGYGGDSDECNNDEGGYGGHLDECNNDEGEDGRDLDESNNEEGDDDGDSDESNNEEGDDDGDWDECNEEGEEESDEDEDDSEVDEAKSVDEQDEKEIDKRDRGNGQGNGLPKAKRRCKNTKDEFRSVKGRGVKRRAVSRPTKRSSIPSYTCQMCGVGFRKPAYLIEHIKVHTGERPFPCPHEGCCRRYKRADHLKRHLVFHEGGSFACPYAGCEVVSAYRDNLARHIKRQHGEEEGSSPKKKRRRDVAVDGHGENRSRSGPDTTVEGQNFQSEGRDLHVSDDDEDDGDGGDDDDEEPPKSGSRSCKRKADLAEATPAPSRVVLSSEERLVTGGVGIQTAVGIEMAVEMEGTSGSRPCAPVTYDSDENDNGGESKKRMRAATDSRSRTQPSGSPKSSHIACRTQGCSEVMEETMGDMCQLAASFSEAAAINVRRNCDGKVGAEEDRVESRVLDDGTEFRGEISKANKVKKAGMLASNQSGGVQENHDSSFCVEIATSKMATTEMATTNGDRTSEEGAVPDGSGRNLGETHIDLTEEVQAHHGMINLNPQIQIPSEKAGEDTYPSSVINQATVVHSSSLLSSRTAAGLEEGAPEGKGSGSGSRGVKEDAIERSEGAPEAKASGSGSGSGSGSRGVEEEDAIERSEGAPEGKESGSGSRGVEEEDAIERSGGDVDGTYGERQGSIAKISSCDDYLIRENNDGSVAGTTYQCGGKEKENLVEEETGACHAGGGGRGGEERESDVAAGGGGGGGGDDDQARGGRTSPAEQSMTPTIEGCRMTRDPRGGVRQEDAGGLRSRPGSRSGEEKEDEILGAVDDGKWTLQGISDDSPLDGKAFHTSVGGGGGGDSEKLESSRFTTWSRSKRGSCSSSRAAAAAAAANATAATATTAQNEGENEREKESCARVDEEEAEEENSSNEGNEDECDSSKNKKAEGTKKRQRFSKKKRSADNADHVVMHSCMEIGCEKFFRYPSQLKRHKLDHHAGTLWTQPRVDLRLCDSHHHAHTCFMDMVSVRSAILFNCWTTEVSFL